MPRSYPTRPIVIKPVVRRLSSAHRLSVATQGVRRVAGRLDRRLPAVTTGYREQLSEGHHCLHVPANIDNLLTALYLFCDDHAIGRRRIGRPPLLSTLNRYGRRAGRRRPAAGWVEATRRACVAKTSSIWSMAICGGPPGLPFVGKSL
jgi:hypothetical protein